MTCVYHVQMRNGTLYEVTTDQHHAGHSEPEFRDHLIGIIEQSMNPDVTADEMLDFAYQGAPKNKAVMLIVFRDLNS